MERPDVDSVEGMPPAIAIRQKNSIRNPRSTVGTTTEIARLPAPAVRARRADDLPAMRHATSPARPPRPSPSGWRSCPRARACWSASSCRSSASAGSAGRGRDESQDSGSEQGRDDDAPELDLLEPPPPADPVAAAIDVLRRKGFARLLVDGQAIGFDDVDAAALADRTSLEVIVDRIRVDAEVRPRLTDSIEVAYHEGGGQAFAIELGAGEGGGPLRHVFTERFECRRCGIVYEVPQPRLFSFNNPFGACPTCHGFGNVMELDLGLVVPDPAKTLNGRAPSSRGPSRTIAPSSRR